MRTTEPRVANNEFSKCAEDTPRRRIESGAKIFTAPADILRITVGAIKIQSDPLGAKAGPPNDRS